MNLLPFGLWPRFGKEVAIKAQPAKTVVKAFAVSALKKQI